MRYFIFVVLFFLAQIASAGDVLIYNKLLIRKVSKTGKPNELVMQVESTTSEKKYTDVYIIGTVEDFVQKLNNKGNFILVETTPQELRPYKVLP